MREKEWESRSGRVREKELESKRKSGSERERVGE